ncbi:Acetylserotonin methytransferase-like protein [Coniochaeta hoffmannii]|uniref:Acetylserotonin methytransferase-like protein n=1 Tax=Coniochaeta hoffmannii TaxID=91930 RepID=A0AA38RVG3_9PEZI|nr:Acetylserotonin methytransferase-like protein [Coniochaeta hoffmannii]
MSAGTVGRWPHRPAEPPVIPPTSSTDELKGLWKVTNGWKASISEGRTYCLKMTAEKDTPVYNLSSATQPFYNLRVDPTSASAYVTLTRHDPHKSYRGVPPPTSSSASTSSKTDSKNWQEALTTTLEEESRRLPPNDGLVALLYPSAATKMALDRPDDPAAVARAEQECARLVWDADSSNYFLVHPALAMPFCVTVERNPAWSRTEYTLEHLESPQHVARLTRDGTGTGWLEVDTALAAKIDAVYLVDVAVAALVLVAHKDDQFARVEVFEPPPAMRVSPDGSVRSARNSTSGRFSRQSKRDTKTEKKRDKKSKRGGGSRMEEFEIDVESQNSESWKLERKEKKQKKDKLPFAIRVVKGLLKATFWVVTIGFRALAAVVAGLAKCLGAEKR